jgi:hypothetical protein
MNSPNHYPIFLFTLLQFLIDLEVSVMVKLGFKYVMSSVPEGPVRYQRSHLVKYLVLICELAICGP